MAIKKDTGFVLRSFDFRNTSKIAHILTKENGKIHGIFKGIRAGKKHFTTPLNTFSLNEFIFYESRNDIWLFSFADLLNDYFYLREDFHKNLIANYIMELTNKILPIYYPVPDIYSLVDTAFCYLEDKENKKVLYLFQIRILELSGFQPHLTACVKCGREVKRKAYFSMKFGGFLCDECFRYDRYARGVSAELISCMRYIQSNDFKLGLRLNISKSTEQELFAILEDFLKYHLETKVKSLSAVNSLYSHRR